MKTRYGFVSNSSSASFIITWWLVESFNTTTFKKAIKDLLDSYSIDTTYDEATDTISFNENTHSSKDKVLTLKQLIEHVETHTTNKFNPSTRQTVFETDWFTIMYNDMRDFGKECHWFIMELLAHSRQFGFMTRIEGENTRS
jgi:hypothetical protein